MKSRVEFPSPAAVELATGVGTLRGLRWGRTGDVSVLALHGWLDNAASFSQLSPLLADADVVAIDLPGHGYSDHLPPGARYHFIDYIPVVLDVMDQLGWPNCVLIGHSLGAAIASFTAATEPDRVRGLFLIDGLGPLSEKPNSAPGRLQRSVRKFADRPATVATEEYPALDTMIDARYRASRISKAGAAALATRNSMQGEQGFRWRTDPRLRLPNPQYLTEEQVLAFLRKVKAPVVLGMASEGLLQGQPQTKERIRAFLDIDVVKLLGAHHLHLDNPRPVAQAVNRFLVKSGTGSNQVPARPN
jgi:pimeloyl-ACP methyl ester carboxylesterase